MILIWSAMGLLDARLHKGLCCKIHSWLRVNANSYADTDADVDADADADADADEKVIAAWMTRAN
jgi:hypothetical protein